jgi:type I site-specific restriction-modification system R (restriction) subunit
MIANPTTGFGGVYVLLTPAGILPVEELIDLVESFELPRGIERALVVKLEHALEAIIDGDLKRACNLLRAFINQVNAQKGKKITEAQAEELLEAAAQIRSVIGCD